MFRTYNKKGSRLAIDTVLFMAVDGVDVKLYPTVREIGPRKILFTKSVVSDHKGFSVVLIRELNGE